MSIYLAHISEDGLRKQTIREHLSGTAKLAGEFAAVFGCETWGAGCGWYHDIGKYSDRFQKRLYGGARTDHATAGAQELFRKNIVAAYCISGHHSGLLDGGTAADSGGEATLSGRMKKQVEDYQAFRAEITEQHFLALPLRQLGEGGYSLSFFIRILFSCLVDADYLDTEAFMSDGAIVRGGYDSVQVLYERLMKHIDPWLKNSDRNTVNGRRTHILKACIKRGEDQQGLYQLTVPTGGGKTVSSLAFALKHAVVHGLDRIIYVIPYTSIIEQNAQVFKDILGRENVLEDHCNVVYDNAEELEMGQLSAENWDSRVIVTTNVQFFESLFSNKTSKCRKLHNIANSVIIFDEAQMLPVPYLKPCIQAISELVYNYHSTAVLCTATQPSLLSFFPEQMKASEICPDVEGQAEFFKRTTMRRLGLISQEQLVSCLCGQEQVLCILNSRKRVQRVYEALKGEGTYHLSTWMYPAHRKRLLKIIKERLQKGLSCRLIATSLVEAGVDFDFPCVYRELAGIDSVVQAAGRCNREGRRKRDACETNVFTMEKEDIHIPQALKLPISVAEQICERYEDLLSLDAIREYFERLYHYKGEGLDAKDIIGQMEHGSRSYLFPFAKVSAQFRLIENDTKTILIAREPEAVTIADEIRFGGHSRRLVREAGQYCVSVYEKDFEAMNGAGLLEPIGLEFYLLRDTGMYTEDRGLVMNVSRGEAVIF
ncbi:CRISPR-associated helicase Cas3' [Diplocloster agilis]|uniref:CRISPR-associated helicase Cas3 n=1 Tax=Diplocloster agilis TaxID=2850323 RepID=A0A949K7H2_9FIRM|nr:CRISPR-associated helicase Cas3' [Diplocloster agilis]MBU9737893.1 CRISPR-associated helicase Cas3' [Diplocloster agilis]MBU9744584.1 CRISPR-associated helicase Cas3' [Diplocloster agilis]